MCSLVASCAKCILLWCCATILASFVSPTCAPMQPSACLSFKRDGCVEGGACNAGTAADCGHTSIERSPNRLGSQLFSARRRRLRLWFVSQCVPPTAYLRCTPKTSAPEARKYSQVCACRATLKAVRALATAAPSCSSAPGTLLALHLFLGLRRLGFGRKCGISQAGMVL